MSSATGRAGLRSIAVAVLVVLVLGATPVLAHAELVSSDPQDGAELAAPPATITLTFSEGLDASKSSFRLIEGGGTSLGTGKAAADGDTAMTLGGLALESGQYVIRWTSVAEDGHLERGTVSFTVLQPTPTPAPTATPASTPTVNPTEDDVISPTPSLAPATAAPSEPQVTPSASPSPDPSEAGSTGGDVLIPILVGLALVAGVGAFVVRRSRSA